jgi:hypothetical protein
MTEQKINYQYKSHIDSVVDLLSIKGLSVLDHIKDLTVINDGNFKIKAFEVYNRDNALSYQHIFESEINLLANIDSINRAIYIFLEPQSQIPDHYDDDDSSYRIVTGVISSKEVLVETANCTVNLDNKTTIGLDAAKVLHNAKNLTNKYCSMLIVCLDQNPFSTNHLIEINENI